MSISVVDTKRLGVAVVVTVARKTTFGQVFVAEKRHEPPLTFDLASTIVAVYTR